MTMAQKLKAKREPKSRLNAEKEIEDEKKIVAKLSTHLMDSMLSGHSLCKLMLSPSQAKYLTQGQTDHLNFVRSNRNKGIRKINMGISNDLIKVAPLPTLFPPWPCAVTVNTNPLLPPSRTTTARQKNCQIRL